MNRRLRIPFIVFTAMGILAGGYACGSFAEVVIIVNKANPAATVKKSVLARYFLKRTTAWDDGTKVMPIDLTADDPARAEFSQSVLESTPKKIESHWISESLTGGKSAPEIVGGGALMKKRVAVEHGAVGYIDRAELDDSVKAVTVVE